MPAAAKTIGVAAEAARQKAEGAFTAAKAATRTAQDEELKAREVMEASYVARRAAWKAGVEAEAEAEAEVEEDARVAETGPGLADAPLPANGGAA